MLEIRNVTKAYQSEGMRVLALDNVSLAVSAGEFVALVGRSGCGKSTLLHMSGAVDFPTAGQIFIDGVITSGRSDAELTRLRRDKIGFIFQSFQLLHTLSVVENVELPLLLAGKAGARKSALERLSWVGVADLAYRLPYQLSGGQQQRVAIARGLVHDPPLLLADEPTGNLDTATGESVIHLLRGITRELKSAVVMATHSVESIALVDRVIQLRDGRITDGLITE